LIRDGEYISIVSADPGPGLWRNKTGIFSPEIAGRIVIDPTSLTCSAYRYTDIEHNENERKRRYIEEMCKLRKESDRDLQKFVEKYQYRKIAYCCTSVQYTLQNMFATKGGHHNFF
jgi:hypothetical protein